MKENLIQKMKALSNLGRVDLLLTLAQADCPMCVGRLAEIVGISESRVSRSLQILSYSGLIVSDRQGARVFYRLNQDDCVAKSLCDCLVRALDVESSVSRVRSADGMTTDVLARKIPNSGKN